MRRITPSAAAWALPFVTALLFVAPTTATPPARPPALDDAAVAHVLDRTGFGGRPEDAAHLRALGLDRYLDEQLHPERLDDAGVRARLARLETLTLDSRTIAERYYAPLLRARREDRRATGDGQAAKARPAAPIAPAAPAADAGAAAPTPAAMDPAERARLRALRRDSRRVLDQLGEQKILRAVYSTRQLEEVLVDFWFNHFNVFAGKGPVRGYLTEYERDVIRPNVLGRFRDLLGAVAKSPAMLFYLDNWQSSDPRTARDATGRTRPGRPRGLNENYARELLELHTLGVDGGYTQADVVEVARAFTGWTIRGPRQGGGYVFDERRHSRGPKTVLGTTIDAGGEGDGEAVLDLLAAHPATATFIATKLARRFVADDPPPALVARAAATFRRTRGDLREVVRTILTAPEFLAADARRVKVKTPFEFVVSALRVTRAEIADASRLVQQVRTLGMPLYFAQPPTGYADTSAAWINAGALVARMNFAVDLTGNRLRGVRVAAAAPARGTDAPAITAEALGSPEFQRR